MTDKVSLTTKEKKLLKFVTNKKNWRMPTYGEIMKLGIYKSKASVHKALDKFKKAKLI